MPVYNLNADFDYWNMLDWNRPDIDCLHTVNLKITMTAMMKIPEQVQPSYPMPEQMTICMRTLHNTFMFPNYAYAFAFFFGTIFSVKYT